MHAVGIGISVVHIGADSRFVLVEADEAVAAGNFAVVGHVEIDETVAADVVAMAGLVEADEPVAAGIVALAGSVDLGDTVALSGLGSGGTAVSVDLAVRADNVVLGIVGSVDTVAQYSPVTVAGMAA